MCSTCHGHVQVLSLLVNNRRMPLVGPGLLAVLERLDSPPVFGDGRVARSLVFSVFFVDRCLSFCPFFC